MRALGADCSGQTHTGLFADHSEQLADECILDRVRLRCIAADRGDTHQHAVSYPTGEAVAQLCQLAAQTRQRRAITDGDPVGDGLLARTLYRHQTRDWQYAVSGFEPADGISGQLETLHAVAGLGLVYLRSRAALIGAIDD